MRVEALQETYADLVAEGAAEFILDDAGKVVAVLLTQVDHQKLAAVDQAYGEELDRRLAEREAKEREAARRLDLEHFILD